MMISQAMESRHPPHFAQTQDFPPKGTAVESFIEVRCGSDVSPYINAQSLHCEVLDIAEIVTIADCVSSEDSFSSTQGIMSNTEIIRETERCGDCLNSSNQCFKTCLDEISCEKSVSPIRNDAPCEESGGQKSLPVTVKDSCDYVSVSATESLSKATGSSDINVSYLATNEVFQDAESCSHNCGACHELTSSCHELTSSDISQKSDFSRTNYFPLEVAHVMEITTSVGEEDDVSFKSLRGTSETVQAHESSESLFFGATSDSVMVPNPHFESYEVDLTLSTDNQASPCHSRTLSSFTNQASVALVDNDPLITPTSILETDGAEMKNKEENERNVCLKSLANVFSVDSMSNVMIVEDTAVKPLTEISCLDSHKKEIKLKEESKDNKLYAVIPDHAIAQPLFVTESREVKMKSKYNNGAYSCMTNMRNEIDSVITDETLVPSHSVSESQEIEMKPGWESEVFVHAAGIANIFDAEKLNASMPEDDVVQPLPVLESFRLKIEAEKEVDICSGVKNEIGVGFMLNAAAVNDSLEWHHSVLKSCGIKKLFEAESDLNSLMAKDAEIQPLLVSESRDVNAISNDDCKMYLCRGIRNEIDPVIGNAPVWPPILESCDTEMKLKVKNKVAFHLMGSININDAGSKLNAVTLGDTKVQPLSLESCKLKMEPEKETDGHLGVGNDCGFDFTSNATVVCNAPVRPPLVLESHEKEISSEKLNKCTFHPTDITDDFCAGRKMKEKITEDVVIQPSLVLDSREEEVKLKDDTNVSVVFDNDSLVWPTSVLKSHESEVKLEDRNKVALHLADVTNIFNADNVVADEAAKMPSSVFFYSCDKTEGIQKEQSKDIAHHTNIGNNFDEKHMLNASVEENSIVMPSPVVKLRRLKIKTKENGEIMLCNQGIVDNFNTNKKFLCSVMKEVGSVEEEPDIELTKHLIKGLSFFTPVRDIIKSHRLFGPSTINTPEISESSLFSGFRDVVYLGNTKQCCGSPAAGMREVELVEECCGHFSVSSAHTNCPGGSVDLSLKKCTQFGSITIFYFQRAQGFTTVSSDGGVALGMEFEHCDVELHSLLDYTFEKDQMHHKSSHRKRKKKRMSISSSVDCENNKTVQTLSSHKRTSLLRAAGIRNIDHSAIQEAAMINASRLACGCFCTDGCLPGVCFCARMEIECLIEREGFPCKCTEENCYNPNGHTKFNPSKIHSHFVCTLMRLEKGEVLCEEQATSADSLEGNRPLVLTNDTTKGPQFDNSTTPISTLDCGLAVEPCVHVETLQTSFMELAHKV